MAKKRSKIEILVGGHGQGKSYLAKKIANSRKDRVIVWDSVNEWTEERALKGAAYFGSFPEYCEHIMGGGRLPTRLVLGTHRKYWEPFLKYAYQSFAKTGGGLLLIEEISRQVSSGHSSEAWLDVVERSRHARLDMLAIATRIMAVPPDLRAQADVWTFFKTSDTDVLREIRKRFGDKAVTTVRNLRKHQTHSLSL